MKQSIISLLFLFVSSSFFANMAYAGDPIPGVNVSLGKNPGGQGITNTSTARDGGFSLTLAQGSYQLTIPYDHVQTLLRGMGKQGSEVTLTVTAGGNNRVLANDKAMPAKIKINP